MDENQQVKAGSELKATTGTLWLPPLSPKDQKELNRTQKKSFAEQAGFADKSLWDWLNLCGVLAIPLVVVAATLAFSIIQTGIAQKQHDSDQAIADQQHIADQQQLLDQQRATTLQTYIDSIQDLLLNHHLLNAKSTDDVATLARARTLTALQGMDSNRKGVLIRFLDEANLIGFLDDHAHQQPAIVDLSQADLSGADLSNANLAGVDLGYANLSNANLSNANLYQVNLNHTNLHQADLDEASIDPVDLTYADLSYATLKHADLVFADIEHTNLSHAVLNGAKLSGATLHADNLNRADLSGADLGGSTVFVGNLSENDLSEANLSNVDLSGVDLSGSILKGARVTSKQLALVKSLQGTTMPNGSIHP